MAAFVRVWRSRSASTVPGRLAGRRVAGPVEVGAQRVVGEQRPPHPQRQFDGARRGMLPDALQHVHEIRVRALQRAGREQGLDRADAPGADLGPGEQPVAPPGRDRPQRPFEMVMPISALPPICRHPFYADTEAARLTGGTTGVRMSA